MGSSRRSLGPATTIAPGTFTKCRLQCPTESTAVVDVVNSAFAVTGDDVVHGVVVDEVA